MHAPNGYKDVRRLATTLATTSDQLCCRDVHRMWQKSYGPWMKNSHMTSSLRRSCVHSLAFPALQQPLINCPIYTSNQIKTSSSTSTSTETSTDGTPRSYHMKKHTSSHSVSSAPHSQDPIGRKLCENLWDDMENYKLSNLQKCFNKAIRAYKHGTE